MRLHVACAARDSRRVEAPDRLPSRLCKLHACDRESNDVCMCVIPRVAYLAPFPHGNLIGLHTVFQWGVLYSSFRQVTAAEAWWVARKCECVLHSSSICGKLYVLIDVPTSNSANRRRHLITERSVFNIKNQILRNDRSKIICRSSRRFMTRKWPKNAP